MLGGISLLQNGMEDGYSSILFAIIRVPFPTLFVWLSSIDSVSIFNNSLLYCAGHSYCLELILQDSRFELIVNLDLWTQIITQNSVQLHFFLFIENSISFLQQMCQSKKLKEFHPKKCIEGCPYLVSKILLISIFFPWSQEFME